MPAVVTAQAWRDSRRQVRLARASEVADPDDDVARRAGELCGRDRTSDVVDAVYTTDLEDLEHLADHIDRPIAIVPIGP